MRALVILLALAVLLMTGCGGQARISGASALSDDELDAAARRPLTAWHEHRRATDLVDAAAAMRERLDDQGYVWAEVVSAPPAVGDGTFGWRHGRGVVDLELSSDVDPPLLLDEMEGIVC